MWFQKWRPNNSDSEKQTRANTFCKMEDKRSRLAVGSCLMWFPYPEGWRLLRNYGGWRWGIGGRLRSVHQLHHCECYACPGWLWQHRDWLNFRFAKFEGILFRWPATHLLFPWNRKGRSEHLRVDVGRGPPAQRHATCLWLELSGLSDWLGSTLYVVQREVRGHGQLCCLIYLPPFSHQTQMFLNELFLLLFLSRHSHWYQKHFAVAVAKLFKPMEVVGPKALCCFCAPWRRGHHMNMLIKSALWSTSTSVFFLVKWND